MFLAGSGESGPTVLGITSLQGAKGYNQPTTRFLVARRIFIKLLPGFAEL
jgi:hypothetical protein